MGRIEILGREGGGREITPGYKVAGGQNPTILVVAVFNFV